MKRYLTILFLSLAMASAQAQMYRYKADFGLSMVDFCDTIPVEAVDGRPVVNVEIDGQRRRLLLDTGAGQGVLYQGGAITGERELGNVVVADGNNRRDTVRVVTMPPFRMGSLLVTDYVATVMPRPIGNRQYDGIIGFDLFNRGLAAKLDMRQGILILTDRRKAFDKEEGYSVRYRMKWFVPYVMVSPFIRHTDEVLFDTGAKELYTMNKDAFDRHVYKSRQVEEQVEARTEGHLSIGLLGAEEKDEVVFLHMDRLDWGGFAFTDLRAITTQGASRIGAQLLQYGAVIINPHKRRMTFQPYDNADSVAVGNRHTNVAFVPVEGRPAVGLVFPESDAYRRGLRHGDIILSIDGVPMRSFADFLNFHFVKGQEHLFLLRDREGIVKEINIIR